MMYGLGAGAASSDGEHTARHAPRRQGFMTPPSQNLTFTDFITKKEVLQIVKSLVQYYDSKFADINGGSKDAPSAAQLQLDCINNGGYD